MTLSPFTTMPMAHRAGSDVRTLFEEKSRSWQAKYRPGGSLSHRLTEFTGVLSGLVPPPARVLDFGCGTGDLAKALAGCGYQLTACDFALGMLESARSGPSAASVEWVALDADWARLPFTSGCFDALVAASVFEYLRDPERDIAECARVLRLGGILVCTVPDPAHRIRKLESVIARLAREPWIGTLTKPSSKARNYITYLRASKNRHGVDGWRDLFASLGLEPANGRSLAVPQGERRPLQMLAVRKIGSR